MRSDEPVNAIAQAPEPQVPETKAWHDHARLLATVPKSEAGFRGCLGLALVVDSTHSDSWVEVDRRLFLPDWTLRWASLVDIPRIYFRLNEKPRPVQWASVRKTSLHFGRPVLRRSPARGWDLVPEPGSGALDSIDPRTDPQLFRVFNALNWAMTSTAYHFRERWQHRRDDFYRAAGLERPAGGGMALLFGEEPQGGLAPPEAWMPMAYVGFDEALAERLFDLATCVGMLNNDASSRCYPEAFQEAFLDALDADMLAYPAPFPGRVAQARPASHHGMPVLEVRLEGDEGQRAVARFSRQARLKVRAGQRVHQGEEVGRERLDLPQRWKRAKNWTSLRWNMLLPRAVARVAPFDDYVRLWFERQILRVKPGFVHVPSGLVTLATVGASDEAELFWDVGHCRTYYREDCEAFVFPTIRLRYWDALRAALPGCVYADFTPDDRRFTSPEDARSLAEAKRVKKNKKRRAQRDRKHAGGPVE
jgi:hypothetical protein